MGKYNDSDISACIGFIGDLFTTSLTFKTLAMYASTCEWAAFHSWSNSEPAVPTVLGRRGARGKVGPPVLAFVSLEPQVPEPGSLTLLALNRELEGLSAFFTVTAAVHIRQAAPIISKASPKEAKCFQAAATQSVTD